MLEVRNISKSFYRKEALDDVSFKVKKGEIFGILGPSGAGKSTTQKILIGLLKDFTGRVDINGQDIKKIKDEYYETIKAWVQKYKFRQSKSVTSLKQIKTEFVELE